MNSIWKIAKKTAAICTVAAICITSAACGSRNSENTLFVELSNAGFGIEWIDPLIEIFESEHPGITVKKSFMTKKDDDMIDKVMSGSTYLDIIFPESDNVFSVYDTPVISGGVKYDHPFADLTDIYNALVPGEQITMKDKMDKSYREKAAISVDGEEKYYTAPWMQAPMGIVVNKKIYRDSFGKFPNTTNELYAFCDNLPDDVTPFIYAVETSYWDDIYEIWMAQYNGSENQKLFWQGYALSGEQAGERYVPSMFEDDGLRVALKVLEELLDPAKGYMHRDSSLDFTKVQNAFLEGDKNILFMPTGSWLEREMSANYLPEEIDIEYIKMPVVSALGDKLGISDAELSAVIDYVDGSVEAIPEFSSGKGLSKDEVVEAVRDARNMTPSLNGYNAVIPAYSSKIELAKEFLQLMASDRGMEAMLLNCGSCTPYRYDITTSPVKDQISEFMYSVNVIAEKGYSFYKKDRFFIVNGLGLVNGISGTISSRLASSESNYHKTADEIITSGVNYVAPLWSSFLSKI